MDIETRFTKLEQEVQSLRIENLYLREVITNKIKVAEENVLTTIHKELFELKTEMKNNTSDKPDHLCGQILIGSTRLHSLYGREYQLPIFLKQPCENKFTDVVNALESLIGNYGLAFSTLYLESLLLLNINYFDIYRIGLVTIYYKNKIIYDIVTGCGGRFDNLQPDLASTKGIKTIYKFCKDNNIKFVWNGQTQINGIDIEYIVNSNTNVV